MTRHRPNTRRPDQSARDLDLVFAVSGGSEDGLGHVMRCATIALEAQRRGLRIAFALRGDALARQALEQQLPGVSILSSPVFDIPMARTRWLILDTRDDIADVLRSARRAGTRTLVLDRVDHVENADWTVVPALHAPSLPHPRVRGGPRWCVVAPAFRALAVPPWPDGRQSLLISFGGADPLDLTTRVASALEEATDVLTAYRLSVDFVLGSAFRDRERIASALRLGGFRVHAPVTRRCMCALMARARVAVVGFGTTLSELAYMGVPALTLTHHEGDLPDAERLEALHISRSGGFGGAFDATRFAAGLREMLADDAWCRRASARGRALLGDGAGDARILDLLAGTRRRVTPALCQVSA